MEWAALNLLLGSFENLNQFHSEFGMDEAYKMLGWEGRAECPVKEAFPSLLEYGKDKVFLKRG